MEQVTISNKIARYKEIDFELVEFVEADAISFLMITTTNPINFFYDDTEFNGELYTSVQELNQTFIK
jgi:hypothetical protein